MTSGPDSVSFDGPSTLIADKEVIVHRGITAAITVSQGELMKLLDSSSSHAS